MNPDGIFPIFFVIWALLGVFGFVFFFLGKNTALKKKLWAPFTIGAAILFLGFGHLMMGGFDSREILLLVPFLSLITYINIRSTKFCDACSKMIINQQFWAKPKFCSRCGEKLH